MDTTATGVIHVSNPRSGVWDREEPWRLVEDLRIGSVAGDAPDVFGEVAAIGVSPHGLIHVIDGHSQEVKVFDQSGQHIRSFGGRGAGPGELANAYSLDWDQVGRLWIVDHGNARYAVFDSAGVPLFTATRSVPGVVFPWLGGIATNGLLHDLTASQEGNIIQYRYYEIDREGNVARRLPPLEYSRSGPPLASLTLYWLSPRLTLAFDRRGAIWFAHTSDYRIIQRNLDGDTVRVITRDFQPEPISAEELDSIRLELQAAPPQLRDPPIPEDRAAIGRLFIDPVGRLFVSKIAAPSEPQSEFDVFDESGRYLGRLSSDLRLLTFPALPIFLGEEVYGVTTDYLGVQYVVRARIEH